MSISTITVGGQSVSVYASIAELKAYAAGSLLPAGVTFTTDNDRLKRLLVTITRLFERQSWIGTPTDLVTPQPLAWPRENVVDRNGTAVANNVLPADVEDGFLEMCVLADTDADVLAGIQAGTSGSNQKRVKSRDKVGELETERETEFFVGTTVGANKRSIFPDSVLKFIKHYLSSTGAVTAAVASGTGHSSAFDDCGPAAGSLGDFGYNSGGIP